MAPQPIVRDIQVNIPFRMLVDGYLDLFLDQGLNPEIGFDAISLDTYHPGDFRWLADRLAAEHRRITIHGPFMDLSAGSPDPMIGKVTRHRLEQTLEWVRLFAPRTVVCHPAYERRRHAGIRDVWMEGSLSVWSRYAEAVASAGSRLMLENTYEDGPEDIRFLYEAIGVQRVGFCLDTGHTAAFGQSPIGEWLDVLGGFLGQFHLHDNHGDRDAHLGMGLGSIDFRPVVEILQKTGDTRPVVTLEPHTEADLPPSIAFLDRIFPSGLSGRNE